MADKDTLTEDDELNKGEEQLVIVEEPPRAEDDGEDDDRPLTRSSDEDDANPDDPDDAEREAIRERRRQEKLERKQRRDEAIKRDKLELDFLRKRNDDLERRLTAQEQRAHHADLSGLDAQINAAAREAEMAERVIAKAVAAGNGEDVTQAMRFRDAAIVRAQQLAAQKNAVAARPASPPAPAVDDLTMTYAKEFLQENPWYDVQGRDEDSAVVLAIDQTLAREGYDPRSEDYWNELRKRAARRLPDKFKAQKSERSARGGPAVGSGREHAPTSTRKEVYISPERKQALIEAGVWDDPTLRMKYIKRYAEYDRNNRNNRT